MAHTRNILVPRRNAEEANLRLHVCDRDVFFGHNNVAGARYLLQMESLDAPDEEQFRWIHS